LQHLTTREAAAYLNVGTTSIKRWCDEGALDCEKTAGGHRRFRVSTLDRFKRGGGVWESFPEQLPSLTRQEIDALDFGVVQLSDEGTVLMYNKWEAEFTGFSVDSVEGRSFFGKVAPCTNNEIVYGVYRKGVEANELNAEIDYTFTYRMDPRNVQLHLYRDPETRTNWMMIRAAL
jgi:photoactive yellow protein